MGRLYQHLRWSPHDLHTGYVTLAWLVALTRALLSPRRRRGTANAQGSLD
jgi:hypothetical protein